MFFNCLKKNFGVYNLTSYNETGKLKANNYNLKNTNSKNLVLEKRAIWDKNNHLIKLFFPKKKENVSLSIYKNHNSTVEFISVRTISIDKIINKYNLKKIDILKLDIEGSEIRVLNFILKNKIFPKQIIVEYVFRKNPTFISYIKLLSIHKSISKNNYFLASISKNGDFLYLLK